MPDRVRGQRDVVRLVQKIAEDERFITITNMEIAARQEEIARMTMAVTAREGKKQQSILDLGVLLFNVGQADNNEQFNVDQLFIEGDDREQRMRVTMAELLRLIRFTYCTDSTANIAANVLAAVEQLLRNHNF